MPKALRAHLCWQRCYWEIKQIKINNTTLISGGGVKLVALSVGGHTGGIVPIIFTRKSLSSQSLAVVHQLTRDDSVG